MTESAIHQPWRAPPRGRIEPSSPRSGVTSAMDRGGAYGGGERALLDLVVVLGAGVGWCWWWVSLVVFWCGADEWRLSCRLVRGVLGLFVLMRLR
jgi:hypothetical protein